jgi:predicted metal-dependent phosphoesterase TrpH
VRSAVSAGIEMFAVTDHDFVDDLQPVVEELEVADVLRARTLLVSKAALNTLSGGEAA